MRKPNFPSFRVRLNQGLRLGQSTLLAAAWLLLPTLRCEAQVALQVGQNFRSSTYDIDSAWLNPQPSIAAGPNHVVEFINDRFSVYSKSNHSLLQAMDNVTFWETAGVSFPDGWDSLGSRILYDPISRRWFAAQADYDTNPANPGYGLNRFLVGSSSTADPTDPWAAVAIRSDPNGDAFVDYPTLGLDSGAVYLSGAMFDPSGQYLGPTLLSIPKAALLASPPEGTNWTSLGILSYTDFGILPQPAICLDGSGHGSVLSPSNFGLDFQTHSLLMGFTAPDPAGPSPSSLPLVYPILVDPYSVPINPPQPNGSSNLDNGDARISASVYELGGVLYAVHGTELNTRAALRWYRIDGSTYSLLESGTISDPSLDLFYPSIAANTAGVVVICCNGCSRSTFITSYAVAGQTVNGFTTFGSPLALQSSETPYQNPGSDGISLWGDYSSTCPDPADPSRFWTVQMYAVAPTIWATQITELIGPVPSALAILRSGASATISWPNSTVPFVLETTTNLSQANWAPVRLNLSTNNGRILAQAPMGNPARFFRLRQQ